MVLRFPSLRNILLAVWRPRAAILLTLLFLIILMYFFALIAYAFFAHDYGDGTCNSLITCLVTTVDQSFKNDGGISGFLTDSYTVDETEATFIDSDGVLGSYVSNRTASVRIGRLLFDNLFNLILLIMVMQILAGLIIDTFGALRDEEEKKKDEIDNYCMICGEDRENIERKTAKLFEDHVFVS